MNDYFDLGVHTRTVTTSSPDAQLWFNRGLNWCFGFNQEEGVKCFQKALEFDPHLAMAHWGIAYGAGPFYNMPWFDFSDDEIAHCTRFCFDHITKAQSLLDGTTEIETGIVNALAERFQKPQGVPLSEFDQWDDDYANAMRALYNQFSSDLDVAALFVEAMMTRTPWKLWDVRSNTPPPGADTLECLDVLERAIEQTIADETPAHPAILHLHIHCLEMSPTPERALDSAHTLRTLCPDAGHMNHMPGHIYVLCGLYEDAKIVSEKAIRADRMYLDYAGPYNFYTSARCHDLHLMMYTCMFLGQFHPAAAAAEEMCETLTKAVLEVPGKPFLAMTMEGYYSMKMHVYVRFGKWQKIIDSPMPDTPALYCVSTSMHHYAKGVSYAALGQIEEAEQQRNWFYESLKQIPTSRKFFNNPALETLAIAENMLNGELEYHKGDGEAGYRYLRKSVKLNDDLHYSEPWAWMHLPRHALGALLLEQKHYEEAEAVYRTDLGMNPNHQRCSHHVDNVWALHGLAECLKYRRESELLPKITKKLQAALEKVDIPITSSCCCRKN